jgi:PAS domain S-box-containing protein
MSENSQFSLARFRRSRKNRTVELSQFFNFCPSAAFLLDAVDDRILQVNRAAEKLTGYTQDELIGLGIESLLEEWDHLRGIKALEFLKEKIGRPIDLLRKDFARLPVTIYAWDEVEPGLVIFTLDQAGPLNGPAKNLGNADNWRQLASLLSLTMDAKPDTTLSRLLQVVRDRLGANSLAIYRTAPDQIHLTCHLHAGDVAWIPEQLPTQDLVNLQKAKLWKASNRPTLAINRLAQSNNYSYVACFPFTINFNERGLLIVADRDQLPPDDLIPFGETVALLMAMIIEKAVYHASLESQCEEISGLINLNSLIEKATSEGLFLLSPDLRIIKVNPSAQSILGYPNHQAAGQGIDQILIGSGTLQSLFSEIRDTGELQPPRQIRLYRRTGEAFLARLHAHPLFTENRLHLILVFLQDLSSEETAQEQARQLEQRAMLGEILAVFAHEVRNPINNISTGLELISMSLPENDANQATIGRLLQDCDRLADLMKSVLAYSRPAEYTMSAMRLEPFLENILERNRTRLERAGVFGSLSIEPNLPPIMGNPRALEQVLTNLVNNALQAMSETGGQIVLKIQRPQQTGGLSEEDNQRFIEVSVADTGPGIPKEQQEKLFQPFFSTNFSGAGLGLAIAKRIVTAHHGSIHVTSFPGGTVFHVLLPVAQTKPIEGSQTEVI